MGLFGFLNKKKNEEPEQDPHDMMLSLNQRQKPKEKSDVEIKVSKNIQLDAPVPEIIHRTPPAEQVEALRTKSIEKKSESLPNIKKLVIPTQAHLAENITPTDNSIVEVVKLKEVELQGKNSKTGLLPESSLNLGEFIDIPLSTFIENIPSQFLSSSTNLFDNTSKVRFTKDEIIPILSQGAFAVVGHALLSRFPEGLTAPEHQNTEEIISIPLESILSLVPPEWFMVLNQDTSSAEKIGEMNNPFATNKEDIIKESLVTPSADSDAISTDPQDTAPSVFDAEETIVQTKFPTTLDAEETIIQTKIPTTLDAEETIVQTKIPATVGEQLILPASRIKAALKPEYFSSNVPDDLELKLPKNKIVGFLAEGNGQLSIAEFNSFSQTSLGKSDSFDKTIQVDLAAIFDLIPPDWFSVQYEDTSKAELVENMSDIFAGAFSEDKKEESETEKVQVEENTQVELEEKEEIQVEENIQVELDEKEEVQIEENTQVELEEKEDTSSSLITGGVFGKMSLFDDDEDDDDILEEDTIAPSIEEEQETVSPVIEEDVITPVIEEDVITPVIEEDVITPVIEEDVITPIIEEDVITPVIEEDVITPVIEEDVITPVIEEDVITPVIEEDVITPVIEEDVITPVIEEDVIAPVIEESNSIEELSLLPGQGKLKSAFEIRPTAENIPELKNSEQSRPSTAPNGIDINRSNLKDLCQLHSAGEKLAQTIIEYREKNGPFNNINELKNIPGVGTSVYRSLTCLQPKADLVAAERKINKIVGFDSDKDYPLGKLIKQAQESFGFKSLILSDKDGFEVCSSGDRSLLESSSEILAATTPQLFKKTRHFLKQSNLPHPEVFTFYLDKTPVTFGVADQVFLVMVHSSDWPDPKHMKKCQELINQLAWFCCHRAVV